jgi:glyoxylase-like metal-dependent hydrolase (beta-lactamase superfamily II)
MFTADHILFDITPNITMWPNMENALGTYLESLKKFRAFPVKKSLPGHREEGDYFGRIDELLQHHDRRVRETEEIVCANPGMTTYEIAGKMTWSIQAKSWQEFPLIQKWFAVGEALSHLDYLLSLGKVERREENGINRYHSLS